MALRERLIEKAAAFLEPGEVGEQAFRARLMLPGTKLAKTTLVVIGTQKSVLILKTSVWSTTTPKELVARVPKSEPISLDASGQWARLQVGAHEVRITGKATRAEAEQLVNTR